MRNFCSIPPNFAQAPSASTTATSPPTATRVAASAAALAAAAAAAPAAAAALLAAAEAAADTELVPLLLYHPATEGSAPATTMAPIAARASAARRSLRTFARAAMQARQFLVWLLYRSCATPQRPSRPALEHCGMCARRSNGAQRLERVRLHCRALSLHLNPKSLHPVPGWLQAQLEPSP